MRKLGHGDIIGSKPVPPASDLGPLFSSQLDQTQISADLACGLRVGPSLPDVESTGGGSSNRYVVENIPIPTEEELKFRHSGWRASRSRVAEAMTRAGTSSSRCIRFERCGSACWVEVAIDGSSARTRGCYCGDRFCLPCATARGCRIRLKLIELMAEGECKFLTLTRRMDGSGLDDSLQHLRDSFAKLREQKIWTENVSAAAYCIEIKRNAEDTDWHVHLHAILRSRWVDKRDWSAAWFAATGGSFVIDIRPITDAAKGASYIAKYATKGFDSSVLKRVDLIVEAMRALSGRRLVGTCGDWYNADLQGDYLPKIAYKTVCSLEVLIDASSRKQAWAVGLLLLLRKSDRGEEPVDRMPGETAAIAEDV